MTLKLTRLLRIMLSTYAGNGQCLAFYKHTHLPVFRRGYWSSKRPRRWAALRGGDLPLVGGECCSRELWWVALKPKIQNSTNGPIVSANMVYSVFSFSSSLYVSHRVLDYCRAWFSELSFSRINESTTGYTFTPCVGSFTSPGTDTR